MDEKQKKHSLMFVPASGEIKQIQLHNKKIRNLLIGVAIFVLINVGFLVYNVISIPRFHKVARVERENEMLRESLDDITTKLDTSRAMLEVLAYKARNYRTMSGLEQISDSAGVIGFGGPQLRLSPDAKGELGIYGLKGARLNYALDSLITQAELHLVSYAELCSVAERSRRILDLTPSIKPMRGYISSVFGYRIDPFTGTRKMHEGIDIVAPRGTPIVATANGTVSYVGWYHGYGKMVKINHTFYETRYAHLDRIDVRRGQRVKRGDQVGTCGRTGRATAIHLHYEVRAGGRPLNPKDYILPENVVVD